MLKNFLQPVNKLPPEVLSKVFEHRRSERDLVAATHVCRYWRSSLVSSPSLWTCLRLHKGTDCTRTYLERSKSVPIDIEFNPQFSWFCRIYSKPLLSHIGRARSLRIHGPINIVREAALSALRDHAPSLQHLEVDGRQDKDRGRGDVIWLPDNFPGQHTPALLSVHFTNAFPTLKSHSLFPNLTTFKLLLQRPASPLRASALFLALSSSPQLKQVFICILTTMIGDIASDILVSLESLEELEYRCSSSEIRVLPHMRLPRLRILTVDTRADILADLLPFDGHLLLSDTTTMVYHHSRKTSRKAEFRGSGVEIGIFSTSLSEDTDPVDWFSDMFPTAFGQIQHLVIKDVSGATFYRTADLPVAVFENLEVLCFVECAVWFIDAISRMLYPQNREGIPCRSLREISCKSRRALIPLNQLARERKRVGSQFELFCDGIPQQDSAT